MSDVNIKVDVRCEMSRRCQVERSSLELELLRLTLAPGKRPLGWRRPGAYCTSLLDPATGRIQQEGLLQRPDRCVIGRAGRQLRRVPHENQLLRAMYQRDQAGRLGCLGSLVNQHRAEGPTSATTADAAAW